MEYLQTIAKPEIIGPLVGFIAVVGWIIVSVAKSYFAHQEKLEKMRLGLDPDVE